MKKIVLLVFSIVFIFTLSSCGIYPKESIRFFPELVRYNLHRSDSSNEFSFNISAISKKRNPEIEFISAEGENTEYLSVTFSDDTFESISKSKINGQYVLLIGIHCKTVTEYIKINSMTLLVDGKETIIDFSIPIENTFYNSDDSEHLISQLGMPFYVFPQSFAGRNETDYDFAVEALEDIVINKFEFNKFLEFADTKVFINNEIKGTLEESLPLKLNKGENLRINGKIKETENNSTGMENTYVNIFVEYSFGGKTLVEYFPLSSTFIGDKTDAETFANYYSDKQH